MRCMKYVYGMFIVWMPLDDNVNSMDIISKLFCDILICFWFKNLPSGISRYILNTNRKYSLVNGWDDCCVVANISSETERNEQLMACGMISLRLCCGHCSDIDSYPFQLKLWCKLPITIFVYNRISCIWWTWKPVYLNTHIYLPNFLYYGIMIGKSLP